MNLRDYLGSHVVDVAFYAYSIHHIAGKWPGDYFSCPFVALRINLFGAQDLAATLLELSNALSNAN